MALLTICGVSKSFHENGQPLLRGRLKWMDLPAFCEAGLGDCTAEARTTPRLQIVQKFKVQEFKETGRCSAETCFDCTQVSLRAPRKEFLIKKYSELCELGASAVNASSQESQNNQMNYYPIFLDLRSRRCLVVGGGEIATRKVTALLGADADVTVISPEVTDTIEANARLRNLRHLKRRYREGDLKGYFLAYAATGEPEVDLLMAVEAHLEGVLLDAGDRPVLCSFITPAVVQRGDLAIAISTGGKCPGFVRRVKRKIEALINPQYGIGLWRLRPSANFDERSGER